MPGLAVTEPATAAPVGAFGKLPALGDFLSRGLDPGFADAWHRWLDRGLADARDGLGDGFLPAYMQAPAWRFALAAGVAGGEPMTGVMVPSVDAVGRGFPLTLAAAGPPAAEAWYGALEAHARAALEEGAAALDAWLAGLVGLEAPASSEPEPEAVAFWGEGSPFVPPGALRFAGLPAAGPDFRRLLLEPEAAVPA